MYGQNKKQNVKGHRNIFVCFAYYIMCVHMSDLASFGFDLLIKVLQISLMILDYYFSSYNVLSVCITV